ncbi:hypothetical protein [Planomonospora algeriensis]
MKTTSRTAGAIVLAATAMGILGSGATPAAATTASASATAGSTMTTGATVTATGVTTTATAGSTTAGPIEHNCGPWTCSVYLSRDLTRRLADASEIATEFLPSCERTRNLMAACYAITTGLRLASWKIRQTADKGQCLRVRYVKRTVQVVGLYSDGSRWCHD